MTKQVKKILIVGLMSGTSMDGIDATLVATDGLELERKNTQHFEKYSYQTTDLLFEAVNKPLDYIKESNKKKKLDYLITMDHLRAVQCLLKKTSILPDVIGFHGQTIYHSSNDKISIQLGDPQLLANLSKIDVIANFRQNDISHNGHGAPIAPIYHEYIAKKLLLPNPCCLINIGGVSNLTYLDNNELIAFDVGPGNGLMDIIVQKRLKLEYDKEGYLASLGKVHFNIVNLFFKHSFFQVHPPKSLDRKTFGKILATIKNNNLSLEDSLATLLEITVISILKGLYFLPQKPKFTLIMGGGIYNLYLVSRLKKFLPGIVKTANEIKLPGDMIEAELIAYLAARSIYNLPYTFPKTTGVKSALSGGKKYYHL